MNAESDFSPTVQSTHPQVVKFNKLLDAMPGIIRLYIFVIKTKNVVSYFRSYSSVNLVSSVGIRESLSTSNNVSLLLVKPIYYNGIIAHKINLLQDNL